MKNAYTLILCSAMLLTGESCKKDTTVEPITIKFFFPNTGSPGDTVRIGGTGFGNSTSSSKIFFNGVSAVINSLHDTYIITTVPPNVTSGKISYTVNGREGASTSEFIILPGNWERKADAPFLPRSGASEFTIGNKGFFGAGIHSTDSIRYLTDWWEYDPTVNQWTSRTAIPFSGGISNAASFAINDKGYLGVGISNLISTRQLWQYDTTTNVWVRKTDYPDELNFSAFGLSIGNKGYVGAGLNSGWWEYDPAIDQWTQKKSVFFGEQDTYGIGLVINNKIYYGLVDGVSWWEYDPAADHWIKKSNYPGIGGDGFAGFTIANKGYVIAPEECWAYDPALDLWTQQAFFANYRVGGVAFSIGSKGYYTTGSDLQGNDKNDLWEFTPAD